MLGVGGALSTGACMILRKKFSARQFSSDCVKYKCNSAQYIGELCRYLINAPPSADDAKLRLDYAFGNGLRPDVWTKFQKRYNVKHIVEFYASTEGNFALFNATDHVGALGFVPRIVDFLYPVKIVKMDPERNDMPYRNAQGLCEFAKPDEVGLLIGVIDNKRVDRRFDGYTDSAATDKKVIRNAFKEGDCFFNSGDLVRRDIYGWFYWSDRTGDTFRWKGEVRAILKERGGGEENKLACLIFFFFCKKLLVCLFPISKLRKLECFNCTSRTCDRRKCWCE